MNILNFKTCLSLGALCFVLAANATAQNDTTGWFAFDGGFGTPRTGNSVVKSGLGQAFMGILQQNNTKVSGGFLSHPLLRGTLLGVKDRDRVPFAFSLLQNFPNPFNPSTRIEYALAEPAMVSLKIFNLLGQQVSTLVDELQQAGNRSVELDASVFPSGVYFYRLQAGKFVDVKKMILMR